MSVIRILVPQLSWIVCVTLWIAIAGFPAVGFAQSLDEDVFAAQVPPNVMLMVDNSGSMNLGIEHASFERGTSTIGCNLHSYITGPTDNSVFFDTIVDDDAREVMVYGRRRNGAAQGTIFGIYIHRTYYTDYTFSASPNDHPSSGRISRRFCGNTLEIWTDGETEDAWIATGFDDEYMGWLFGLNQADNVNFEGPAGNQNAPATIISEFQDHENGRDFNSGQTFGIYHRSRIASARHIAADVIYQTNTDCPAFTPSCTAAEDRVRFGLGLFDASSDGAYVKVPIDAYSTNRAALESSVNSIEALTATPLAESLFKLYTYFMSRNSADIPEGVVAGNTFPRYRYDAVDGTFVSSGAGVPPSPVVEECQKNFVIMITDGEPTNDNFYAGRAQAQDFGNFNNLIGDYFTDTPGDVDSPETGAPWCCSGTGYLDDVAAFMQDTDFRPDFPNTLNKVDVYTVGFTTQGLVNALLTKTAANGNGLFFTGNQSDILTEALVNSVQDIISKSQGFSAATVPAARTSQGGSLYTSLFQPSTDRSFWPGLMRSYRITAAGEILDSAGNCALENLVDPLLCAGGTFKPESAAPPFWNAAKEMPDPNQRNLFVSVLASGSVPTMVQWDHNVTAAQLGMVAPSTSDYAPAGTINSVNDLDEAVRAATAGCEWGTGMTSAGTDEFSGCVTRRVFVEGVSELDLLGDIFHSNPVVVGPPASFIDEPSYGAFANDLTYARRDRLIYAGANDGFLHAFNAGIYGVPTANQYGEGTGVEHFGFMPWGARTKVVDLSKTSSTLHPLTVDGSPSVADVWIDRNSDPADAKVPSEWSTILISGLREGGEHYFALDITNPAAATFPTYLWEFPAENDLVWQAYVGQTWSQPVITRIRLDGFGSEVVEKWVAIVGFGYHPSGDPNKSGPAGYDPLALKGRGIAMIDVETGQPIAVRKFGSGTGDVPEMEFAIASQPGVMDVNQDGFADLIYVGDLGGNIWKWVVRDLGTLNPSAAQLHQPNWPFRKFFDEDPTTLAIGDARSFYFAPAATLSRGVLHLGLGSGQRSDMNCTSASPTNVCTRTNRYYVLKDRDLWDTATSTPIDGRSAPNGGQLTDTTPLEDQCPIIEPRGFFFEVSGDGEKFVTNSEVFDSFFFSSTFTPDIANVCEPSGNSLLYGFLARCGQGFFGPPSPTSPIAGIERTLDIGEGIPTDARLSIAPGDGGNRLIISKQNGEIINIDSGTSEAEHGVLYWRELD